MFCTYTSILYYIFRCAASNDYVIWIKLHCTLYDVEAPHPNAQTLGFFSLRLLLGPLTSAFWEVQTPLQRENNNGLLVAHFLQETTQMHATNIPDHLKTLATFSG